MLIEQLLEDMKTAMREKDVVRKNTITMLRAQIKQVEVDERRTLTDEDIHAIIQKQIREKTKAIPEFEAGHRQDLVDEANKEMEILKVYLPEQLSRAQIEAEVDQAIAEVGKNIGPLMKTMKQKLQGKADMALVNSIVKEKLI